MKKIDTTSWRQCCMEELFDVVKGRRLTKADRIDGDINYIGASIFDNGITAKIGNKEHIHPAGTITVCYNCSDIGTTFYQEEPFWATDDVNVLYPKFQMTSNIAHFLCPIIHKAGQKYTYEDKWTAEKMRKTIIFLPAKNEDPDWQYMEDYMRQIELRAQISISAFSDNNYSNISVNTAYWKEFKIGDLFPTINKPKVYHTREVVEDSYGIPYIVRSKFNNGIKCRIKPDGLVCSPKGVITFGAENAAFFYQKEEWCGGRDIYYIDTRNIKHYACMFLVACLNQITEKYTYNFGLFPDLLKQESIKLPATPSGEPDWHYMEMYMRGVEAIVKNKLSLLVPHKSEVAIKDAANVTFNNATVTYIDQSKTYNVK